MTADRLTDADLDAIEDRANSATPGPWHHHAASSQAGPWDFTVDAEDPEFGEWFTVAFTEAVEGGDNNGRFIAHARTDVPALLAEVRRLRSALVGCWDEYEELMPDRLREQVKAALGYVEFVGTISATVESETLRALLGGDDG